MHTDNRAELQELIGSDYQLQWIIGHGGMSTVWLADDAANDREVAIKVLRPEFSGNEEFLTRFRNEARTAEGIAAENVVATYDYREVPTDEGFPMCFIVLEYIRGESLADLIAREGHLEEDVALDVLEQAANGLSAIHQMGLVHRDIKPGNLMITQNGTVKITDFGIAKAAAAVPLTRTGMVVGTAQYVSPEQAQGQPVSAASDVYSLGVVGFEMLSGRRPFNGDSSVSVALAHVSNEPPPLSTSISAQTRELIGIALRKDPTIRFPDGGALQRAVADVREGKRPQNPAATASTRRVVAEPTQQEATATIAAVSDGTTLHPEVAAEQPAPVRQQPKEPKPALKQQPKKSKNDGFGTGVGIALLVLLVGGGALWAYSSGLIGNTGDKETSTTPPPPPETTETTTEVETQAPEPTTVTRERQTQAPPSTLYNEPEERRPRQTQQQPAPQQPREEPQPQPEQPAPEQPEQPAPQQPPANNNPLPNLGPIELPGL